jgi:hypothetical protein
VIGIAVVCPEVHDKYLHTDIIKDGDKLSMKFKAVASSSGGDE